MTDGGEQKPVVSAGRAPEEYSDVSSPVTRDTSDGQMQAATTSRPVSAPRTVTPSVAGEGTRERILAAATQIFNERGYTGAALRDIAAAAQVDLALLSYYFGNKAGLFEASVTSVLDPVVDLKAIVAGDREHAGAIIARKVIGMMEDEVQQAATTGFFRTLVATDPASADVRDSVVSAFTGILDHVVDDDEFANEYSLLVAEVLGLIFARWVVPIEPLASADPAVIEQLFAARYQSRLDAIEVILREHSA